MAIGRSGKYEVAVPPVDTTVDGEADALLDTSPGMVKVCDTDPEGPVITISWSPGAKLAGTVQWKVTKPVLSAVCGASLIAPGLICAETTCPGTNPNPYKV